MLGSSKDKFTKVDGIHTCGPASERPTGGIEGGVNDLDIEFLPSASRSRHRKKVPTEPNWFEVNCAKTSGDESKVRASTLPNVVKVREYWLAAELVGSSEPSAIVS